MSFRKLSLIFITFLLASLLILQWWSITSFSAEVSNKVGESAFEVSRSTAQKLIFDQPRLELMTFSMDTKVQAADRQSATRALTRIKQDVLIQLVDKQKDDYLVLSADKQKWQIPIPRTGIDESLESFSQNVLYSTGALLVLGIIAAIFFTGKLASPLKSLQTASRKIGEGEFGVQIDDKSKWHSQEIKMTLESFNQMSKRIVDLQQQNEALRNREHLFEITEISKGLAHTLRNPLNTLSLAVDELGFTEQEEKKQQLSKVAKEQIKRIDKWVKSLMDLMTTDDNLITQVNLNSVIESIVEDFKLANTKSIEFDFITESSENYLSGVDSELRGLIHSLIANAVEASSNRDKIKIELIKNNQQFQIEIKDNGNGFAPEILANLFNPHNTDKTYGAGMGLYLAHRISKYKYQGDLKVANRDTGGSQITLTLMDRG